MPYMYILRGGDGTLYTGTAWTLAPRREQADGEPPEVGITASGRSSRWPLRLVYVEWHDRIDEAYYREREVHGWRRWRKVRLIAEGNGRIVSDEFPS